MEKPTFFKEKYRPKTIQDLTFNPDLSAKLLRLSAAQLPSNLIIYGPPGSGKKTRALALINSLYENDNKVFHLKYKEATIEKTVFVYSESIYHLELTPTSFGSNDINILATFVNERVYNSRYFTGDNHIILINNANNISPLAFQALRAIMEKKSSTARFIFIANNISGIPSPIRSRCILIRCPQPSKEDTIKILTNIGLQEKLKLTKTSLIKIINSATTGLQGINLNNIFHVLQMSYPTFEKYTNYTNPVYKTMDKIVKFIQIAPSKITSKSINDLRDAIYELMLLTVDATQIYKYILSHILKSIVYSDQQKRKAIEIIANSEYLYRQSNKLPIHLESCIFSLVQNLNTFSI